MSTLQRSRMSVAAPDAPSRVSFFVHDLASNPIVRAYPIALAFQRLGWDVEVLGFRYDDRPVYAPYSRAFRYITLPTHGEVGRVLRDARRLAQQATGDVVYGFKPLVTSYYPALLASGMGRRRALLLDVEDDELVNRAQGILQNLRRHLVGGWSHVDALKYRLLLHPLTRRAAAVTVSSSRLQARHRGTVMLHGPDESKFDPSSFDARACRTAFGLPQDAPTALFAGVPHPHKGLRDVVHSLRNRRVPYVLVYAGPTDHPEAQWAAEQLGERFRSLGFIDNDRMPELLAAVDVVPIAQARTRFAESQIPAKLLEAMAMARGIVATRVSDLATLLNVDGPEPRGWIVEPGDRAALAAALTDAGERPDERTRRGAAAREFFLANASVGAIERRLRRILDRLAQEGLLPERVMGQQ